MVEYVAKKSIWKALSFWWIVASIFLLIPIFIVIYRIIAVQYDKIIFYKDKIVIQKGLFNTTRKTIAFTGVFAVSYDQTFWQRICNYGDVKVDVVGAHNIDTTYIKDPRQLVSYLRRKIVKKENVVTFMR